MNIRTIYRNYKDIDLDELRKNYARLYYFGLGFIQLKLNDVERLHFYSSKLPVITEEPHNHRYGFLSRVLKGEITNNVWTTGIPGEKDGNYLMVSESCNPDIKAPPVETPVFAMPMDSLTYHPGESYIMTQDMYHTVQAKECITHLIRTHKTANFAFVLREKGKPAVCPFSKKIPEGELWEIMKEMVES